MSIDDARTGLGSAAPRSVTPYSVSIPQTFGMATGSAYLRPGPTLIHDGRSARSVGTIRWCGPSLRARSRTPTGSTCARPDARRSSSPAVFAVLRRGRQHARGALRLVRLVRRARLRRLRRSAPPPVPRLRAARASWAGCSIALGTAVADTSGLPWSSTLVVAFLVIRSRERSAATSPRAAPPPRSPSCSP